MIHEKKLHLTIPPNFHELPLRKMTYALPGATLGLLNHDSTVALSMYRVRGVTN
jgi:hypothetical protein